MINLGRLNLRENAAQGRAVGKIAVLKKEPVAIKGMVGPEMLDARTHQITRPPNDPVNDITFFEQELGQIRTVLARDTGDERTLRFRHGGSIIEAAGLDKTERDRCLR